jgi:hypothetical protein
MNPDIIHACLIIDDPLLRENYGYLNYRKLLGLMDAHNFVATIAFIPWNYKRTDKKIADLFKARPDRFSLCVHGCDHTGGEFGATDIVYLDKKVKLATARMVEHEKRTGIPFDRVMVFPQGIFSNEALTALKMNNYLAAVSTEAMPVNGSFATSFPFYKRNKPEDIIACASDPVFIVLHHEYLKNGYERLTDFVDEFNDRQNNVKWDSVGSIIRCYVSNDEERNDDAVCVDLSGLTMNGFRENAKILMRRYASEVRDNYLSKNEFLLSSAKKVKNIICKS